MQTDLYLIRHGETATNRARLIQGWNSEPLNALGRWQAERAGARLAQVGLRALYASPLDRARETAMIVGQAAGLEPSLVDGLREMDTGLQVIVGEEITTADGELVGLYLEKRVAPGQSAERTIDLVHEQGGLAYVPHPFSRNRRRHLRRAVLESVAAKLDIVEVFNAREVASSSNVRALEFAREHSLPGGVGSDSHRAIEIGRAYIDIAPFVTPQELLVALREGKVTGTLSGFAIHVRTWVDIGQKFMRTRVARLRSSAR